MAALYQQALRFPCCVILYRRLFEKIQTAATDWEQESAPCSTVARESSLFLRKDCFERIGGMNPLYFMYWEEADLCRRARLLGWRVTVVPGSLCKHFAGGSAEENGPGFLQLRNHFIYLLTDPFHSFTRNILSTVRLSLTYIKQQVWDRPSLRGTSKLSHAVCSTIANLHRCYRAWKKPCRL